MRIHYKRLKISFIVFFVFFLFSSIVNAASFTKRTSTNITIPDQSQAFTTVNITEVPAGSKVTSVSITYRVEHTYFYLY